MRDFLVEFINYNGPIIVLLTFFLVGFASKIASCYIYDYELDRIGAIKGIKDGIIADIQISYIDRQNCGIPVNNTKVFVDNMLNMWKKYGISVARIENMGDMCAYIGIAITAFFDMVILTERDNLGERFNVMTCVYVYTALAIIFFAILRLWEKVVSSQYKRNLLSDAVTDYIDNQLCNINDLEAVMEYLTNKEEAELEESEGKAGTEHEEYGNEYGDESMEEELDEADEQSKIADAGDEQIEEEQQAQADAKNDGNVAEDKENVITQVLDEYLA